MVQTFHDKQQSIRMEPVKGGNKILLVDNEADVTITFKAILQDAGFIVNTYEDPLIALSNFIPRFYDLVILDIGMPKMNGIELGIIQGHVSPLLIFLIPQRLLQH